MAKIPDKAEHQRRFAGLPTAQRRAIVRAVNKGRGVDDRKLAPLAVGVARRQQRFWRLAWLMGPVVGLTQLFGDGGVQLALVNAAAATAALGLMSWFWYARARRAENANLALSGSRRGSGGSIHDPQARSAGQRMRSHLPGGSSSPEPSDAGSGEAIAADRATPIPPGQRPYRPRGRKRR